VRERGPEEAGDFLGFCSIGFVRITSLAGVVVFLVTLNPNIRIKTTSIPVIFIFKENPSLLRSNGLLWLLMGMSNR